MLKKILTFSLLSLTLFASESTWYKQNHQESWTKKHKSKNWNKEYKRTSNYNKYLQNSGDFTKNFSDKEIKDVNKLSKGTILEGIKEQKEKGNSARARLAEMQKCEKNAKTPQERKNCWLTKKQIEFNKKMDSKHIKYNVDYSKQLKAMQEKYKTQLNQDPSKIKRNNYVPQWDKIKFPNKGSYNE